MQIEQIEPFIDSTVGVFREMFREEPEYMIPYLIDRRSREGWDVSGIIGIAGDAKGVVVISFASDLARALTERVVGEGEVLSDDDVLDAVGEVVNIIAGNAKRGLEHWRLSISLPSIVRGGDHAVAWQAGIPIVGIPFKIGAGRFHLAVGLENIVKPK